MKKSQFFYAFVLVLVLSVYYFDYYKGEENKKKKDEASVLVTVPKEQISKIELVNGGEEIQLVKEDKTWMLKKPLVDLADESTMADWINTLTSEKNTESIGDGETISWLNYGLDKPKAILKVFKANGDKIQIELATRKNFEGSSYLRKDQGPLVLVASASWQSLLDKNVLALRDKRVLRMPTTDLQIVTFRRGKDLLKLESKEGLWLVNDRSDLKFSQNAIREVINALSEMRATEFVTEVEPTEGQKKEMNLKSPSLLAELKFKDGKNWVAEFSESKEQVWLAYPRDQNKVVKIDKAQIEKISKVTLDSLRDRELPFIFKKEDVKKINIELTKNPEKSMELSKASGQWKVTTPDEVDEKAVDDLMERLSQMRVSEFLDGKIKALGIEPPLQKVTLADQDGKIIWSLIIGESFKKKINNSESQFFYVKTSTYDDVVTVAENSVSSLDFTKIVKDKTTDKKASAAEQEKKQ